MSGKVFHSRFRPGLAWLLVNLLSLFLFALLSPRTTAQTPTSRLWEILEQDGGEATSEAISKAIEKLREEMRINRFSFSIDPATPLGKLLPAPPDSAKMPLPWHVRSLDEAPEVLFEKPRKPKSLSRAKVQKETEQIALRIARINHLNRKEPDYFVKALIQERQDLHGLPFVVGDASRMSKEASDAFAVEVATIRMLEIHRLELTGIAASLRMHKEIAPLAGGVRALVRTASLVQILGPSPKDAQLQLVENLSDAIDIYATRALAQLAVFSFHAEVRQAALDALQVRSARETTSTLLRGLNYPWQAVNENAANAIAKLKRNDLIPKLLDALDQSEAWAPRKINGKHVVREVVRLNHHRSCLLCHPPANTPDVEQDEFGHALNIVTGPVPVPGRPFSFGRYGQSMNSPDIFVRADVTYLRQDFSLMQPVKDAAPWPELQRFDFLVREREVTAEEVESYQAWRRKQGPDYVPAHHRAVHQALRALTGRDVREPTAAAWREALGTR